MKWRNTETTYFNWQIAESATAVIWVLGMVALYLKYGF